MRHLVSLLSLVLVATQTIAVPPPSHDDAPLRCVQFVDDREGWAAGDDGVIWHSIDGGKTWERQKTGTRASIRAIHFLTPYSGWAVGRREQPGDLGSVGVLLSTNDGGISWLERTVGLLPGLMRVRFEDEKRGMVQGDATAAYPSGTFETTDGGASWRPIARPTDTKPANDATLPLSAEALAVCDIHCRANVGESWWVAGRMGPNIFRSRDAGKTWQRQQTPVAVPLHGLFNAQRIAGVGGWRTGYDPRYDRRRTNLDASSR